MNAIDDKMILVPGMTHDLGGGFSIRRLLPFRKKQMVGPFIFFDHMGPFEFVPTPESDIRPHPHIGLSTLTYLYKGRMVHRDHLGHVQTILPGEVNWMTAGKGIVHSERAHVDDHKKKIAMEGLQFWLALPDEKEDQEPSFHHYEKSSLPVFTGEKFSATVILGKAFNLTSPVKVSSPSLFLDIQTQGDSEINIVPENTNFEIAIYVLSGQISRGTEVVKEGHLAIFENANNLNLNSSSNGHFIIIGGEAFKTPRHIYWNFVSTSKAKIDLAKKAWRDETFPLIPGDDKERTPLDE
jgi:redox-sensitive bicupin YhaK (pirin superfamily)